MTSEPEAEADEADELALTAEEANIRWLLAAVLHHDSSRSGGSQPPSV